MIEKNKSSKVLGLIPARSGSKELPGKNTKIFAGKELIGWTIEAAKKSKVIDRVVVSTDCKNIAEISEKFGAEIPFIRPVELATDNSSSTDVIMHTLSNIDNVDYVILLQPTSPLRTAVDIDLAFHGMLQSNAKSCVSLTLSKSSPYIMYKLNEQSKVKNIVSDAKSYTRRQDFPQSYELNGALYISDINSFKENQSFISNDTFGYIMDAEKSHDIDNFEDFLTAEASFETLKNKKGNC